MMQRMVLMAEADMSWGEICRGRLVASGFTVTTIIDGLACPSNSRKRPCVLSRAWK